VQLSQCVLMFEKCSDGISAGRQAILNVTSIRPQTLSSSSFPNAHSSIIQPQMQAASYGKNYAGTVYVCKI
jgi:hypothetical protein